MEEQERIDKGLTDFDDPERGDDDERVESGEEAIDESGHNPTQQRIDSGTDAEAHGHFDEVDRPGAA